MEVMTAPARAMRRRAQILSADRRELMASCGTWTWKSGGKQIEDGLGDADVGLDAGHQELRFLSGLDFDPEVLVAKAGEGELAGRRVAEGGGQRCHRRAQSLGVLFAAYDRYPEILAGFDQDLDSRQVALVGHDGVDPILDVDHQQGGLIAGEQSVHGCLRGRAFYRRRRLRVEGFPGGVPA